MLGLKNIGGDRVSRGSYWNFSTGDRVQMEAEGVLPGGQDNIYFKFPPVLMLMAGPILGLIYAVFLPFIGIAMLVTVVFKKLFSGILAGVWKGASFGWQPSEAYLSGKKKGKKPEKTEKVEKTDEEKQ